jgi:hypothetical protein
MLSHDSRLRCNFVDLYYVLYGTRRPLCIPVPELAAILNVKHERHASPMQDKEVITFFNFQWCCFAFDSACDAEFLAVEAPLLYHLFFARSECIAGKWYLSAHFIFKITQVILIKFDIGEQY